MLAAAGTADSAGGSGLATFALDGSDLRFLDHDPGVLHPDWSPDGSAIAFASDRSGGYDIYVVSPRTGQETRLTSGPDWDLYPDWSPNGTRILFLSGSSLYTMDPDGGNRAFVFSPAEDASWSPDGQQIVLKQDDGEIYTINADGTGKTLVPTRTSPFEILETQSLSPDWQALPVDTPSSHARPKGATPVYASLVPAMRACESPNETHGPPLAFGACAPPVAASANLTLGGGTTPAQSIGFVRLKALGSAGGADDADIAIRLSLTNVMRKADLSDYTGELGLDLGLRLTDREGAVSQTTQKFGLSATVPCAATADTTLGGNCFVDTTAEALIPAAVKEGARSVFALDPITVRDGGSDEDADTPAGDGVLATQGVFAP
jgi:hypothetical protein